MKRKTKTFFRAGAQVFLAVIITFVLILVFQKPFDTVHHDLRILVTGDVHGRFFDSTYTSDALRPSLQNVSYYVDSIRNAEGEGNVLLIDAGDFLQGDNATYYYNFVDTLSPHLASRMMSYMGYDAWVVGNHDIEAGHPVFDRVSSELDGFGIVTLAGNTPGEDGQNYFQEYKIFKKAGLKVLLIGYTNANIDNWVSKDVSYGMDFKSIASLADSRVKALRKRYRPDVVIVAMHSGTGKGDGKTLESEALDVFNSVEGVDLVIAAHDHSQLTQDKGTACLLNSGSRAGYLGNCLVSVRKKLNKKVSVETEVSLIPVKTNRVDSEMLEAFHDDYLKVKEFTVRPVGKLEIPLLSRDSYIGMNDYVNLIQTVQLKATGADISFAAPLSFNGYVPAGTVIYDDMFTIYPYENQLFTISLTGKQIKDYLEYSYDMWVGGDDAYVLNIENRPDSRSGSKRWSFVARTYNFDSAAGLIYEVYPLNEKGSRVAVKSMADGSPFDENAVYKVAVTSYRANGGGGLLVNGAGIAPEDLEGLVVDRYKEIRDYVYDYFCAHDTVCRTDINDASLLGSWSFEPESVQKRIVRERDMVFGK